MRTKRNCSTSPCLGLLVILLSMGVLTLSFVTGLRAAPLPTSGKPSNYPGWWFQREVIPRTTGATGHVYPVDYQGANDYAAINQGQLKQLATAAFDEWASLPGGPGSEVTAMVKGWFITDPVTGEFDLDTNGKRQPKVTAGTSDFAPVNLGMLKTVAKPFYDRLLDLQYVNDYPWANGAANDFAMANIGQAKNLFSFDALKDGDLDTIPDMWEVAHGLNPNNVSDATGDPDYDGISNLNEYTNHTDPQNYYNGTMPYITKASNSDNQTGEPDAWLAEPIKVRVMRSDNQSIPMVNAPVVFKVALGRGKVSIATSSQPEVEMLSLTTDANGYASVYYRQPNRHGVVSRISVTATAGVRSAQTIFKASATANPDPENDPSSDPAGDWDDDGLTNGEEIEIGSDPESDQSDDDGISDGWDSMPADSEISFPRAESPYFVFVDIGPGKVTAINTFGQAVGNDDTGGVSSAFFWNSEQRKTLIGRNAKAMGLNDLGQIVGQAEFPIPGSAGNYYVHAAYWVDADAEPLDLGSLTEKDSNHNGVIDPGEKWESMAVAINNAGMIVGNSSWLTVSGWTNGSKATRFFKSGKPQHLGPGNVDDVNSQSYITALDEKGNIVGHVTGGDKAGGALWENGRYTKNLGADVRPSGITAAPTDDLRYRYYISATDISSGSGVMLMAPRDSSAFITKALAVPTPLGLTLNGRAFNTSGRGALNGKDTNVVPGVVLPSDDVTLQDVTAQAVNGALGTRSRNVTSGGLRAGISYAVRAAIATMKAADDEITMLAALDKEANPSSASPATPPATPPRPPSSADLDFFNNVDPTSDHPVLADVMSDASEDGIGMWAVVNFDDDDNDGKADFEDTDGVIATENGRVKIKENDLLFLGVTGYAGARYQLKFDDHIKIWRNANRTSPLASGEEFSIPVRELPPGVHVPKGQSWTGFWIEGMKPHNSKSGTMITVAVKNGAAGWQDTDKVKVRVAYPIVALFGDVDLWNNDKKELDDMLIARVGADPTRRRDMLREKVQGTYLVSGKTKAGNEVCYSVTICWTEKAAQIAKTVLAMEDTHIVLTGHSHWGIGMAFGGKQFKTYEEFFRMAGGGTPAISLGGFETGTHVALNIFTAGGFHDAGAIGKIMAKVANNPMNRVIAGVPGLPNIDRFPNAENPVVAPGIAFAQRDEPCLLASGASVPVRWNFVPTWDWDREVAADNKRTVLQLATSLPATLKYGSIFHNSCNSFRYFIESFQHGDVITTWQPVKDRRLAKDYVNGLITGDSWANIEARLELDEQDTPERWRPRKSMEMTSFPPAP